MLQQLHAANIHLPTPIVVALFQVCVVVYDALSRDAQGTARPLFVDLRRSQGGLETRLEAPMDPSRGGDVGPVDDLARMIQSSRA